MTVVADLPAPPVPSPDVPEPTHTPLRNARIGDPIWKPALRIAQIRKDKLSDLWKEALRRYVARNKYLLEDDAVWLEMVRKGEVDPL